MVTEAGTGKARDSAEPVTDHVPFLMLGLDLPPAPLFKDALEKVIIPQVYTPLGCRRKAYLARGLAVAGGRVG